MCKKRKLFIFGGLDPSTSRPVLETETFDEEEGIWTIHKSLPEIEGHVYQNGADAGCLLTMEGKIYSVGKDIISIDWRTLKVNIITKLKASAEGEGCVFLKLENFDYGFFFLSGDWFSLKSLSWTTFSKPGPAFNIVMFENKPTILGAANMDQGCKATKCKGKSLIGDKKVLQLDVDQNKWNTVGTMEQARLGYSSAVEVPSYVCDILEYGEKIYTTVQTESLKTLTWEEIEDGVVTVQDATDLETFESKCSNESDVDIKSPIEKTDVVEKSMSLFVKSCSQRFGKNFFVRIYFVLLIYIAMCKHT